MGDPKLYPEELDTISLIRIELSKVCMVRDEQLLEAAIAFAKGINVLDLLDEKGEREKLTAHYME